MKKNFIPILILIGLIWIFISLVYKPQGIQSTLWQPGYIRFNQGFELRSRYNPNGIRNLTFRLLEIPSKFSIIPELWISSAGIFNGPDVRTPI